MSRSHADFYSKRIIFRCFGALFQSVASRCNCGWGDRSWLLRFRMEAPRPGAIRFSSAEQRSFHDGTPHGSRSDSRILRHSSDAGPADRLHAQGAPRERLAVRELSHGRGSRSRRAHSQRQFLHELPSGDRHGQARDQEGRCVFRSRRGHSLAARLWLRAFGARASSITRRIFARASIARNATAIWRRRPSPSAKSTSRWAFAFSVTSSTTHRLIASHVITKARGRDGRLFLAPANSNCHSERKSRVVWRFPRFFRGRETQRGICFALFLWRPPCL